MRDNGGERLGIVVVIIVIIVIRVIRVVIIHGYTLRV